ncbi:MAG TPA: anthranilate phosphoribosyltransferase [Acidimicrobiales bacterium]|nr:anthranilate phosphoribosyltransferase [Acidimicrobiales bacterium]
MRQPSDLAPPAVPAAPASLDDLGGWKAVLGALTARRDLTRPEAEAAMTEILEGRATPAQIAAFCVALRMKGESVEEMSGLLGAMLDRAESVPLPPGADVVDTCGTGGDRSHSINVSTVSALVVAAAGAKVCKHGNRAASSACGSADVLEALGVVVDLGPPAVAACIEQVGMGFCLAPRFHPALRHAGPTRRELGVATVFNFLGPLANPARARRQALGVSDPAMAEKMIGVLAGNGAERALVFYGHDGLDELSTTTTSTVFELRHGAIRTYDVDPVTLGIPPARPEELRGADAATNARLARSVLEGAMGAQRDFVLLNAAAGLVAAGRADDLAGGLVQAAAAVDEGRATAVLEGLVRASQEQAELQAAAAGG